MHVMSLRKCIYGLESEALYLVRLITLKNISMLQDLRRIIEMLYMCIFSLSLPFKIRKLIPKRNLNIYPGKIKIAKQKERRRKIKR